MRNITPTEPSFAAPHFQASLDADSAALAMSALKTTRDAIARWSGRRSVCLPLARDVFRVSPQARWLADAQRGLSAWIEHGGFSQFDGGSAPLPALLTPTLHSVPALPQSDSRNESANACMD